MTRAALALLCLAGCGDGTHPVTPMVDAGPTDFVAPCTTTAGENVTFRKLAPTVGSSAVLVTSPPNDPRLFVVEQPGIIQIIDAGEQLRAQPFLDISADNHGPVSAGGELGLLGLAFHPQYAQNGKFYVFYTRNNPGSGAQYLDVLSQFTVSSDASVADPTSEVVLVSIPDPYSNHNGGMIEFGADGALYVGTGDGGSAGDPLRNAQNPSVMLGKFLRIDVDQPNPTPEVFITGVRNPWRWSFDRATGDLWIGDVGQAAIEEVDVLPAGQQAGANLGWSKFEGTTCCATASDQCQQSPPYQDCDATGITFPLDQRKHSDGWAAIIGGQVYRGACYPDLTGWYFYSDEVKNQLAKAQRKRDGTLDIVDLPYQFTGGVSSIHADSRGELYATDVTGAIFQLEVTP